MKALQIGDLVSRIPIIQGGMGVGISLSSLAGAVAKEGAIGVISTAQIGFSEPDYEVNPLAANLRMVGEHIVRARKIAPNGIIGVNIMVATKQYASYVKEAISHGIDLIISGAGLPMELPSLAKGSDTKLVPIVSSAKAAAVILKMWDRKDHRVPDAFIVEGPKAGGHLGFSKDDVLGYTQRRFDEEIIKIQKETKVYEDKYEKSIPLIIAGGIDSCELAEHYYHLGADGIQIAAPFVTTVECDADIRYKEAYMNASKENIVLIESPVGMPARALHNQFVKQIMDGQVPVEKCYGCIKGCNPRETKYCITRALINAVTGDVEHGLIFCGASAYKKKTLSTVRQVLEEYVEL